MDKEAIREELKKVRDEIKRIKSDFLKKKDEKEGHFEEGEKISKQIDTLYEEVKVIEKEHNLDKINEDLESKKAEYNALKVELEKVEKEFSQIKNKSREKRPIVKTVSVEKAKKDLSKLDLKLQTQVLSLDKEADLIKKMAELKEVVDRVEGKSTDNSDFKKAKKDLNTIRRKFNNSERKIRSLYKQIRLISKEKKKKYKLIDELRDQKKKAFEEFRLQKKDYSGLGKNLKDLFKKEETLLEELGESPNQRKKVHEKEIKQKQKEVEDKLMKKGGILTTEDLLVLQAKK